MNPVLTTDGGLEQTATHIASRQCDGAAGAGVGASYDGKGMIAAAVVCAIRDRPAGQQSASFLVPENL
jgi:hypothetical protein